MCKPHYRPHDPAVSSHRQPGRLTQSWDCNNSRTGRGYLYGSGLHIDRGRGKVFPGGHETQTQQLEDIVQNDIDAILLGMFGIMQSDAVEFLDLLNEGIVD